MSLELRTSSVSVCKRCRTASMELAREAFSREPSFMDTVLPMNSISSRKCPETCFGSALWQATRPHSLPSCISEMARSTEWLRSSGRSVSGFRGGRIGTVGASLSARMRTRFFSYSARACGGMSLAGKWWLSKVGNTLLRLSAMTSPFQLVSKR